MKHHKKDNKAKSANHSVPINIPSGNICKLLKAIEHGDGFQLPVTKVVKTPGIAKLFIIGRMKYPVVVSIAVYEKIEQYLSITAIEDAQKAV